MRAGTGSSTKAINQRLEKEILKLPLLFSAPLIPLHHHRPGDVFVLSPIRGIPSNNPPPLAIIPPLLSAEDRKNRYFSNNSPLVIDYLATRGIIARNSSDTSQVG